MDLKLEANNKRKLKEYIQKIDDLGFLKILINLNVLRKKLIIKIKILVDLIFYVNNNKS